MTMSGARAPAIQVGMTFNHAPRSAQRGVALVVALIFLLMLTILGVTVMQTASLEGRMAANTQETNRIFEATQSAIDFALSDKYIFTNPSELTYSYPANSNPQTVLFSASGPYADITVDVTALWLSKADPGRQSDLSKIGAQGEYEDAIIKLQGIANSALSKSNATTTQGYVQRMHASKDFVP